VSALGDLLGEIAAAPAGPRTAAFFDFDGTLIAGYSATAFAREQLRRLRVSPLQVAELARTRLEIALQRREEEELVRAAIRGFAGLTEGELAEMGRKLFQASIAGQVHPEARELVHAHQRRGHRVVIASSATRYQVEPLAEDLGIRDLLCTRLEVKGGALTGEVKGPVLWGAGKAEAVRRLATRARLPLENAHGYGNGDEDVEFLSLLGHPHPVNPGPELARVAQERKWRTLRFATRRPLDAGLLARNATALYGMGVATLAGLGIGLLNRDRRLAINLVTSLAPDVALPLAGVEVAVVRGEEHLWEHRPAVFLFNHQSYLDGLIVGHLLRSDFTAVAKKELEWTPFGIFGQIGDFAFVDRSDSAQAREAVAPVVERIRRGISLVIAPEGTRSATQTVGPFKKGAFHLARQAGVPVVPIVIRNSGDLLWKRSLITRPGRVEVAVLPPIAVARWRERDLDQRVEEVRRLYVETLAAWPDGSAPRPAGSGRRPRSPATATRRAPRKAGAGSARTRAARAPGRRRRGEAS
jgi:HAD superfamily hydrolase (TIGR01490 family)